MSWKESRWYSILTITCPRCHEGKLFPPNTLYNFYKLSKMNESCSCCGQPFSPEPGYYFGAMFVSYAINVMIFVGIWVALRFFVKEITLTMLLIVLFVVVVGLLPFNFRLSRAMWINIFVGYEGPCSKIKKYS
jgi:uncharacterized protein (DUF983 family)